jgi:hypothetical protein
MEITKEGMAIGELRLVSRVQAVFWAGKDLA